MTRTLAVLLCLALPSVAYADAIEGPPACPPGARGRSAHEGQWCVAATCDAGCESGETCAERRVCTRTAMVIPGGLRPTEPPPEPREIVVATCEASSACTGTEEPPPPFVGTMPSTPPTCTTMRVCVPSALPAMPTTAAATPIPSAGGGAAPTTTTSEPPRSCLCAIGASRGDRLALTMTALVLALAWRRRR